MQTGLWPRHTWFFKLLLSTTSVYVCVCVWTYLRICFCLPPRLLITSGVVWIPYDWLHKYYRFYMAAIVGIVSRRDFTIEARYRNQGNRSTLVLYNYVNGCLKQLYISNKTEHFSYKVDVVWHVSKHLKEELAWATVKRLWVVSNVMLFNTVISVRIELFWVFKILFVLLCDP